MTFSLTPQEQNERLAAAVTSYGLNTRSYNRSSEKREMDRQRKEATEKFAVSLRSESIEILLCHCRSFRFSHPLEDHKKLSSPYDWRTFEQRETWRVR